MTGHRKSGTQPPLIVHIIHHLVMGGLENGLINLINRMPPERYRHAIVCLSHYSQFRDRLQRSDVPVIALGKRPGKDPATYLQLWRLLRKLRADIVHTRNIAAVDCAPIAWAAGTTARVHGEHGWDMFDLHGTERRQRLLRRLSSPFIHQYVCVSHHLANWLEQEVGIDRARIRHICNGVDSDRFHPGSSGREILPNGFRDPDFIVIGSVARMQPVKNPLALVRAFLGLAKSQPRNNRVRLVMIGDGPLRDEALRLLGERRCSDLAWLPGAREDVPQLLRAMDVFVLPSLNEGVSNTILEAMATGRPVVASNVGGNPELVIDQVTGLLVPPADDMALVRALASYVDAPHLLRAHGHAGRTRVEQHFSVGRMLESYMDVYERVLARVKSQ